MLLSNDLNLEQITFNNHHQYLNMEIIIQITGGPQAIAGHRKYSGSQEKFYEWPFL